MRYDTFFWDFDGTLFNSYPYIVQRFQRGARTLGVEADAGEVLALSKRSLRRLCDVLSVRHGVDGAALLDAYRAHPDPEAYARIQPYDGIPAALAAVVAAGGQNILYTHSGPETLGALERHGLKALFTAFITAPSSFPPKPAPDALLDMIAALGLDPSRCIMIGDRDIDVLAGRGAGMDSALFDPDGFFANTSATYHFATVEALEEALLRKG